MYRPTVPQSARTPTNFSPVSPFDAARQGQGGFRDPRGLGSAPAQRVPVPQAWLRGAVSSQSYLDSAGNDRMYPYPPMQPEEVVSVPWQAKHLRVAAPRARDGEESETEDGDVQRRKKQQQKTKKNGIPVGIQLPPPEMRPAAIPTANSPPPLSPVASAYGMVYHGDPAPMAVVPGQKPTGRAASHTTGLARGLGLAAHPTRKDGVWRHGA
uniref:Uncharacterized protein n=1 Tax=Mycena chlorophos TaxID=658473 RepID=A0ABQ0LUR1_MYCCL|nr:predicted protein [Mycena chlorophos]